MIPTILGICAILLLLTYFVAKGQEVTKQIIPGTPSVSTETLQATVETVEGNDLVVRTRDGKIREFRVPESRKFIIDKQEKTVHDLKPGTRLTAKATTTTTPVIERTITVGTGTVWWVSGNTLIATLPSGENRIFAVNDDFRFTVDGEKAPVWQFRKGMKISAEKIVEEPITEIEENTVITGRAPRNKKR